MSFTTSGGLGEAETAGAVMNIVPKTGGNRFTGSFFASGANSSLQASNYTQALKDAGLTAPNPLRKVYDVDGAYGGPIVRDKLWVLRERARTRDEPVRHEPVLQQERR